MQSLCFPPTTDNSERGAENPLVLVRIKSPQDTGEVLNRMLQSIEKFFMLQSNVDDSLLPVLQKFHTPALYDSLIILYI